MGLITWSPLGGVFGEVVETLGGGSLLEEIHNGGGGGSRLLNAYNLCLEHGVEDGSKLSASWSCYNILALLQCQLLLHYDEYLSIQNHKAK